MLGTIGEVERIDNTVIGDAVNLASRLEGLTSGYGARILISADVAKELGNAHQLRALGKHLVKGKRTPVLIYEVLDADEPTLSQKKQELDSLFQEAVSKFARRRIQEAQEIFARVLESNPEDRAAQSFYKRCRRYLPTS